MISYSQQQSQLSHQQQPPRFNLNAENSQTSCIPVQQQPNQLRKSQQLDTKAAGIKKETPQGKSIFGKNEIHRNSSKEDEDNEEFQINLYAKSPLSAGKVSQHSAAQVVKDMDKFEEKPAKKELQNGIQQATMQRQLSSLQAQFLQAQLAKQEASAASTLIDIQKLKYLAQLEKMIPPSNCTSSADTSNPPQDQDKLEDTAVSASNFAVQPVIQNTNHTTNMIVNGSIQQSSMINGNISENSKLYNNQKQANGINQSNAANLRIQVGSTKGDLGSILEEKMKIIEERKKISRIESKASQKESPNARSSSCFSKGKKRMSLKVENRKTRRNFGSKYNRSAKSQQRLSISFDLYSIKESKSEESADGSPLDGYYSSSNNKGGFETFFSNGTTSTEQLIPLCEEKTRINSQNYVSTKNEGKKEDSQVAQNQIEQTQTQENVKIVNKENNSDNKEAEVVVVLDNQTQKQRNQLQVSNTQQAVVIKNLTIPSEMKLPNNSKFIMGGCQDESSPKESTLINLYRKNENKGVASDNTNLFSEQQQQLQQQQQPAQRNSCVHGKSQTQHDKCDISIVSVDEPNNKNDKIKISSVTATAAPNKQILKKQGSSLSLRIDQSPKQDKSVIQANHNKMPPHYLELELRQLLPDKPDSNQGSLRKSSEIKVIQFSQPDGNAGGLMQSFKRRSSLLEKEQENTQLPLKTEGHHSGSRDSRNKKQNKDEEAEEQGRSSKHYDNSPQQMSRRSNLQIDSQFDSDKQLLRHSLPQSASSSANYSSSSYRDQFKQRLELQNIRKNAPNFYILGDKKRENCTGKPDSACSSPKSSFNKTKTSLNHYHQPQQQQQMMKGTHQVKAASEQASAKASSEVSSPQLASRIQSEKNKLSVIALQQKIMQQLGKAGTAGNKRIANTESAGEGIIDLHSPSSNHMRSPISLGSDKRTITTMGSSSNLHHFTNGHNSVDAKAKKYDSSSDSQITTHLLQSNYDTEPVMESSSKRIPVTFHVSDFTRGNTVLSTASSASGLSESLLSKAQSPQMLSSNKNLNLHRSAKEELVQSVNGLASLKTLPTRLAPAGLKQFPAVPTKSEASIKKQLIVRPLVLDDQIQKKKPQIKFNVESKVKSYILAAQQQSQQKTSVWSQTSASSLSQQNQQVQDLSNFHIPRGVSGEHQSLQQISSSTCYVSNKNQINDSVYSAKQNTSTQHKNTMPVQQSQNKKAQPEQFQTIINCFNPSMMQTQIQQQQQQQMQRADQQSISLNPSETKSTNGGSTHQSAAQVNQERMNNSKQRSQISLQLIQQIFTPAEEAANRQQQRQVPRQYSQWST